MSAAAADGTGGRRVDGGSERLLPSRHCRADPRLLDAGVYGSRPLPPLAETVSRALGATAPGEPDPETESGAALAALWSRRELRSRLSSLLSDHAARRGARVIVAADGPSLGLASPVADRLGLPLETWGTGSGSAAGPEPPDRRGGVARYLVAGVLRDGEAGRFLQGPTGGPPAAGAGAVARIREPGRDDLDDGRLLYLIDL